MRLWYHRHESIHMSLYLLLIRQINTDLRLSSHSLSLLNGLFLSRGRRLKSPLGPWINDTNSGTWFIEPSSEHLHRKLGSVWYFHPRIPRHSGRPTYSTTGSVCEPPAIVHRAQVLLQGNNINLQWSLLHPAYYSSKPGLFS
jgi:hypothetical protein